MSTDTEEQRILINDCLNRISKLTDWESRFMANIRIRLEANKPLTEKQDELLNEIWERVT
jgi:hypothetical protein